MDSHSDFTGDTMSNVTVKELTAKQADRGVKSSVFTLKFLQRIVMILIGAVLMAVSLEVFLVPNGVIDGGITGISIMVSELTHLPLGIFLTLLNLPFLILGYKQIGKTLPYPHYSGSL